MGYYDDHSPNRAGNRNKPPKKSTWFFAGLFGAIIGMLIFTIFAPLLSEYGVLPYVVSTNTNGTSPAVNQPANTTTPGKTENVSVNVATAVTKAVDKVSPAVVAVINLQKANLYGNQLTETGMGSGVIYKKQNGYAYIVTNNHVVEGENKLEVRLSDNTKLTAKLLGKDSLYDLAVLRVKADKVKAVASFGNSDAIKRGEPAIAIGNPLGFSGTVTEGIISSPLRTIPVDTNNDNQDDWEADVIQTDAAINPGNSGGALVNIEGQVIGINSLKIAQSSSDGVSVEGIGFAIPINTVEPIISELEANGKIVRPYLGISMIDLSQIPVQDIRSLKIPNTVKNGIIINQVQKGSPAAKAGLEAGDVVTVIDNHKIQDSMDFRHYLITKYTVNQTIQLTYYKNGKKQTTDVTLGGHVF